MTLSKASGTGTLGGATPQLVTPASTTITFSGLTYGTIENGVVLAADWTGSGPGTDSTATIDVVGDSATSPDGSGPLTVQGEAAGAEAVLRNGANGPVTLTVESCAGDQTETAPCTTGTQFVLTGDFKGLYDNADPAEIDWICPGDVCRHQYPGDEGTEPEPPDTDYLYNYDCEYYDNCGDDFAEREVEEDFTWYPVYISVQERRAQPFARAGRCVPLPSSLEDPDKFALLHQTGADRRPGRPDGGLLRRRERDHQGGQCLHRRAHDPGAVRGGPQAAPVTWPTGQSRG